ncbi:UNVERIFIED_CONTAM: hypothetical protein LK11_12715 [Mumia flava]
MIAAVVSVAALTGCGSDEPDDSACRGVADGGTVLVQGDNTPLTESVTAGVGSIDVNPDGASATLMLSTADGNPGKVRTVRVVVNGTFKAGGQAFDVAQICRGSVTLSSTQPTS